MIFLERRQRRLVEGAGSEERILTFTRKRYPPLDDARVSALDFSA